MRLRSPRSECGHGARGGFFPEGVNVLPFRNATRQESNAALFARAKNGGDNAAQNAY